MSTTALLYINIMCNKDSGKEQLYAGTMGRSRRINTHSAITADSDLTTEDNIARFVQ